MHDAEIFEATGEKQISTSYAYLHILFPQHMIQRQNPRHTGNMQLLLGGQRLARCCGGERHSQAAYGAGAGRQQHCPTRAGARWALGRLTLTARATGCSWPVAGRCVSTYQVLTHHNLPRLDATYLTTSLRTASYDSYHASTHCILPRLDTLHLTTP